MRRERTRERREQGTVKVGEERRKREQENGENREQGEWEKRGGRERTKERREQGKGSS